MPNLSRPRRPALCTAGQALLALGLCLASAMAAAAPLAFDSTFGTAGKVTTNLFRSSSDDDARAVVVQPDGKTVMAGPCARWVNYIPSDICVARFTSAGALDPTFGTFGVFTMPPPVGEAVIRALTLDGTKIVAAGSCGSGTAQDFCVLRLNANGTLDTTFNGTGLVVTPVGLLDDQAYAVAMDGTRVLVAGQCEVTGSTDMCLVRYNGDGTLDGTFGSGGKLIPPISTYRDGAFALLVLAGKAYAGGTCGPPPLSFCVVRFTSTGALDATWGSGGVSYNMYPAVTQSRVTALTPSGSRLLAGGECRNPTNLDFCMLRLDTNGNADATLNGNGWVTRPMGTGDDTLTGMQVVSTNTILSGHCDSGGKKVFCMVSITEAGGISGSFNGGVPLLDAIGSADAYAWGLAAGFSTLTLAGTCGTGLLQLDFCLARYDAFGQRDTSLGGAGAVVQDLRASPGYDGPSALLRQADGKLLAAGFCTDGIDQYRCVARYNTNGSLDSTFAAQGIAMLSVGSPAYGSSIAIDATNRIYVAGSCNNGASICITRLDANGVVDAAYGTGGDASAPMGVSVTVYNVPGVVVDAAGNAVAGGHCDNTVGQDFCIVKFTAGGALDVGFGTGGRTFVNVGYNDASASFVADGTGFIVAGTCAPSGPTRFCLVRFTAAGMPDNAFGGAGTGVSVIPMGTGAAMGAAVAVANGGIWIAGPCTVNGTTDFCVARLLPDGTLDTSYSGDGKTSAPIGSFGDTPYALVPDGTGLLVAGECGNDVNGASYDMCIARFLADGTLDLAFNDSGSFKTTLGTGTSRVRGLVRDGTRVVALAECRTSAGGDDFCLAALALLPNDVPRAPTGVSAVAGDAQATVSFTPPSDNGGNAILDYTATCGLHSTTALATSLLVTGLDNGVTVGCVVTARNSAGTGPASSPPVSVTPRKVTSISLSTNINPSAFGAQIFLNAVVTGQGPSGLVVFKDGGVVMPNGCSGGTVTSGAASCFTSALSVGTHSLTAEYSGDTANAPSNSAPYSHTVIAAGFQLTAGATGTGSGSLTSSPAGIDCGSACLASFSSGTQVTLTATPAPGSVFGFWFGACSGTGGCVVTMNAAKTVTAVFNLVAPVPRLLSIVRNGAGTGSVTSAPAGIDCGTTCAANFDTGATVTLSATPAAGSTFAGWTGGGCSGAGSCVVTMDVAKDVTATFSVQAFSLSVSKSGAGSGTLTSSPGGINCGATCSGNFAPGASISLAAAPAVGSIFSGWSGACAGTGACNVTMDAAKSVTATFALAASIPRLANISTRMQVLTGADVLIGGFIIGGSAPKTVVVRARGPSLIPLGVANALGNPVLQLFSGPTQIAANDNWQTDVNSATLSSSGYAPSDPQEAAVYTTLGPGAYTAIVTGAGGTTGVGIIEVFEVDHPEIPLINIATRGQVLTGGDVMIGGFIIQGDAPQTVVVRARGPSLTSQGVPGALANPVLQLYSGQTVIAANDNWQSAANAATLLASGFAPGDPLESAILITLPPGAYTAIVTGAGGGTGVGIIEVFAQ